ncbi:hypothetical protein LIER_35512 [Lithospermum erythrorhizon]|uniref:CCHC-type domain-containing protein n=1 Tax=Lithospermum erythrorhizon TaxID=34254 RepID=A0AAV3NT11_LITER
MVLKPDPNGQEQQQQNHRQANLPAFTTDPAAYPMGLAANLSVSTVTDKTHQPSLPRIRISTDARDQGRGLMGFVDGSSPCPPPFSPNAAIWEQKDVAIVNTLISSLSESVMPTALGKHTLQLRSRLCELKQGDLSVSKYCNQALLIKDGSAAIGEEPTYDDFLWQVLTNPKSDLSDIRMSILARQEVPDFEEGFGLGSARGRGGFQSSSRFQQRSPRWSVMCQLCGQRDHLATACPKFLNSSPSAHSVYSRTPSRQNTWYQDTGASHHVTPDLTQLQLHDEYYGSH